MISNDETPSLAGGRITAVAEGGAAHKAGLGPGDRLLEAEGTPLLDVIE